MKICYVHAMFFPYVRGIEKHIFEIGKRLAKKHEVHLITTKLKGTASYELIEGIHVHRFPAIKIPIFDPPLLIDSATAVYKKLQELKPDIVHLHTHWSFACVIGTYKYIRDTKTKIVFTRHNTIGDCDWWLKPLAIPFDKICFKVLRYCDKVIAVSDFVHKLLRDNGIPEKLLITIPNGGLKPYKTFKRVSNKNVVFVGRLVEVKGLMTLLRAVPIVLQKIPDAKFYIVGKGVQYSQLKATATLLNLNGSVKFTGFLPDAEKNKIVSEAAVSVLPSYREAMGIVGAEAMALGKPIVASRVGGIPEMVIDGGTGFLVSPKDPESLAEKIILLLENSKLREKMGKAALKRAKSFTWDNVAKQTEAVY